MVLRKIFKLLALSLVATGVESCSRREHSEMPFQDTDPEERLLYGHKPKDTANDKSNMIQLAFNEGMKPLLNMQFRVMVQSGSGGVTIAKFKDKTFLVRDGIMYKCDGIISEIDGSCFGSTTRFLVQKKSDYCYIPVNAQLNDWYCIDPDGRSTNSGIINNTPYCGSVAGDALLISISDYRKLCESGGVTYTYFTYNKVGDHGPEIKCSGEEPTICTLQGVGANVIG